MRRQTPAFLHVADAVKNGLTKVSVRSVDTDVVVLAVALYKKLDAQDLWVAFGSEAHFHHAPVHELVASLHPRACVTLPAFHALTGCDTVSAFSGRGKHTAWETWKSFPDVTDAFEKMLQMPCSISESSMALLE